MKHTNNNLPHTEDAQTKKWLLAPLILAVIFVNTVNGQGNKAVTLRPPDSSLIYMDYRNNWPNYISVSTDAIIHAEVEGIKNLSLTVHNQTDKMLDEVVVKVDYITSNGKTCKSQNVTLNNIGANSAKAVAAPDSDKGICVKMEIVSMQARSFHFCYNRNTKTGSNVDPYLCN